MCLLDIFCFRAITKHKSRVAISPVRDGHRSDRTVTDKQTITTNLCVWLIIPTGETFVTARHMISNHRHWEADRSRQKARQNA